MSKQAVKRQREPAHSRPALRLPELNARIRARRTQLDLTGAELAQRAGISASYVSLIEKGVKVPDEDVAAQLARVLEDDPDLYRAWVRAARLGLDKLELLTRLEAASRAPAYVSLVESGQAVPRLAATEDGAADLAQRMREVAARLASPSPAERSSEPHAVAAIPVLAAGADPRVLDTGRPTPAVVDRLLLDRRLLGADPEGLFACDVTPDAMTHLRGVAQPGDRVVFRRDVRLAPDRICAVRRRGGLVLSRVLVSNRALLLLPGEGESGFESIELADGQTPADLVAGSHVLLIRG